MTEARPHLVAVEDPAPAPAAGPQGTPDARRAGAPGRRGPGRLLWLVAGVALVCAVGWAVSAGRASRLDGELAASRKELAAARQRIGALEKHLSRIRDQSALLGREMDGLVERVGALAGELEALGRLAARDPEAPGEVAGGEAPAAGSARRSEPAVSPGGGAEEPQAASEAPIQDGPTPRP